MRYNLFLLFLLPFHLLMGQVNRWQASGLNSFLLQNTVTGICEDDAGYLWANTQFGIYRYDGVSAKAFTLGNKNIQILSNRFGYIHPVPNSSSYFTYNEFNGFILRGGQIHLVTLPQTETILVNENTWIRVKKNRINQAIEVFPRTINGTTEIALFKNDTLIKSPKGYFSLQQQRVVAPINPKFHLVSIHGQCLAIAHDGIYQVKFSQSLQFKKIDALKGEKNYIPNARGDLYFNIKDRVYAWDEKSQKTHELLVYSKSKISSLLKHKNNIFLGTSTDGIQISKRFPGHLLTQKSRLAADNYIYSFAWNKYLQSYCVVSPKGISRADAISAPTNMLVETPSSASFIFSDIKDRIWWMSAGKSLTIYDPQKKAIIAAFPQSDDVIRIIEHRNHPFVIVDRKGLSTLDIQTGKQTKFFQIKDQNSILTAYKSNHAWLIGTERGLIIHTPNTQKILLSNETVRSILPLDEDRYLIGTYSHGLFIYQHAATTQVPLDERHLLEATVQLNKDADGDIWVICNRGIFIWKKDRLLRGEKADYFLETNVDLPVEELNGGQTPQVFENNQIAIASSRGLLRFKKSDILEPINPKQIKWVSTQIDGDNMFPTQLHNVGANHQNIQFNFDISFVENPNNFQVEYKLNGLDSLWHPFPINRKLIFSRLPAGDYSLQIRKNASEYARTYAQFNIEKIWYMRPWAWLLAGLGIVLMTSITYYSRILLLKRNQLILNKEIREKTKEIQQNLARLAESKKALKKEYRQRNKLYSILMHDLTSPLAFLSNFSVSQTKNPTDPKEAFRIIAQTSNDLHGFITEFLFWLGHQKNNLNIVKKPIEVVELIQEVVQLYSNIGALKQNKVLFFPNNKRIVFETDSEILKIILRNLLDNANKFTNHGIIKVSSNLTKQKNLEITIEDTGEGLPYFVQELLKQKISLNNFNPSINANHKMGLQISKEFLQQLHGDLNVETSAQTGTKFIITFYPSSDPKDGIN